MKLVAPQQDFGNCNSIASIICNRNCPFGISGLAKASSSFLSQQDIIFALLIIRYKR